MFSIGKESSVSTLRILFLKYSLVMDVFTLLDIEGTSSEEMKPRLPNVAVEITMCCRLILRLDEM